jgi:4-aminobutyrate aminotransferase-like enzyme
VLLEPVQGNGGQIPAPNGYLQEVRKICNEHGVPLIFDEVQTGFGRCGTMFAADYYKTIPDIMVIGKGLASGFPLAAIMTTDSYDVFEPGDFGFTHSGQAVACAAALATIDVLLEEKLPENAAKMGNLMMTRLKELACKYDIIGDVRGVGLLIGVELVKDRKQPAVDECTKIRQKMFEKGVICGVSGVGNTGNVIKFKPPLCISEEQVEKVLEVFEETLREVR